MQNPVVHQPSVPRSALVFNIAHGADTLSGIPATGAPVVEGSSTETIKGLMNEAAAIYNHALLIDIVTTPRATADITLNDLNGFSCSPVITQSVAATARAHGFSIAYNRKDADQSLIRSGMSQEFLRHAIQIEIASDLSETAPVKIALNVLSLKLAKLMAI